MQQLAKCIKKPKGTWSVTMDHVVRSALPAASVCIPTYVQINYVGI